jgi:hypothetical protein
VDNWVEEVRNFPCYAIVSPRHCLRLQKLICLGTPSGFSFSSLYDRILAATCPVAASSEVQLVIPTHSINSFSIEPDAAKEVQSVRGRDIVTWDLEQSERISKLSRNGFG